MCMLKFQQVLTSEPFLLGPSAPPSYNETLNSVRLSVLFLLDVEVFCPVCCVRDVYLRCPAPRPVPLACQASCYAHKMNRKDLSSILIHQSINGGR